MASWFRSKSFVKVGIAFNATCAGVFAMLAVMSYQRADWHAFAYSLSGVWLMSLCVLMMVMTSKSLKLSDEWNESLKPTITTVYVFKNGNVACFDQYGRQMSEYQGDDALEKIKAVYDGPIHYQP